MTRYEFPSMVAKDPTQDVTIKNGSGFVYAPGDFTFSTPLATFDRYGYPKSAIGCTSEGLTEEFYVDDHPVVWWKSAGYAFLVSSHSGMLASTQAAETAAEAAANAALLAKQAAQDALAGMASATDTGVSRLVTDPTTATRAALNAVFAAVGLAAQTVDTNQRYRAILLSDGTVRAVPVDAAAPAAPTILTATAGPTSARLTWTVSAGADHYIVYRDLTQIATTTSPFFRDTAAAGSRFSYTVAASNAYSMRSDLSAAVPVYMDPALNSPPVISITTWPATVPTTGSCVVRVNATDVDAQVLALALSADSGSLRPTPDPSVWILTL